MAKNAKMLGAVADWALVLGGLNVGLAVVWQDIVAMLPSVLPTVAYSAVGIAAVYTIVKKFM